MRREGREVLFDRLRVTDVRQKCIEKRKDRLDRGHGDSRLGHHAQQARGLQCDRLAAGIRAADDELALGIVERQGERHHRCLPRAQALFEQGMAALREFQHRRRRVCKARPNAIKLSSKATPRLEPVDLSQGGRALSDCVGLLSDLLRHRQEDASGLGLFFFDQPHQLVVLLDGLERLEVNRLAAGGGAMYHAGNAPLVFRLHGNHKSLPANRDQVLLCAPAFAKTTESTAQALFNHSLLALDLAADAAQISRCVVAERAVGIETRAQRTCQMGQLRARRQQAQRL